MKNKNRPASSSSIVMKKIMIQQFQYNISYYRGIDKDLYITKLIVLKYIQFEINK